MLLMPWVYDEKLNGLMMESTLDPCLACSNCSVRAIVIVRSPITASTNEYLVVCGETGQLLPYLSESKSGENLQRGLLVSREEPQAPELGCPIH